MAQGDAAGVNGSNRILFHGAPRLRMMPNGCLGSPVLVLLFGLDRGFLMDVGPEPIGELRSTLNSSLTVRFRIYHGHKELGFRTVGVAPGFRLTTFAPA